MRLRMEVHGEPVPQGRPRFRHMGARVIAYDPKKCRLYKEAVKDEARLNAPSAPLEGSLTMTLRIYHKIPKSASRAKLERMNAGFIRPTTKPDIDNVQKAVMDALTGVWYVDDSQIVESHVGKWYSENPRVEVTVEEATDET